MPGIRAALRVLMLTCQRPGEVMGMVIDELHRLDEIDAAYWELPPHRMRRAGVTSCRWSGLRATSC